MLIKVVPLNETNYGYLIVDEKTNECAIVDVSGDLQRVLAAIESHEGELKVTKILTTHKHWDHEGGNREMSLMMMMKHKPLQIVGSTVDGVEACNKFVEDEEEFTIGESISVRCLLTPGHTIGHTSYFVEEGDDRAVFTGDCLFVGGCGKFYEGTGADMYNSLYNKLAKLPRDTKVYCGHEYTMANYKFALTLEPQNPDLLAAVNKAKALRANNQPTVPSTIDQELKTNPFLRVHEETIQAACGMPEEDDLGAVMAKVRQMKDSFK